MNLFIAIASSVLYVRLRLLVLENNGVGVVVMAPYEILEIQPDAESRIRRVYRHLAVKFDLDLF